MKRAYIYVKAEDVTACKELIKTMIKRDRVKGIIEVTEEEANHYAYEAARFFNCLEMDFRYDLKEWAYKELEKIE